MTGLPALRLAVETAIKIEGPDATIRLDTLLNLIDKAGDVQ